MDRDASAEDVDTLARRTGIAWLAEAPLGPFALHTAAAAICGFHLGPWLLSRWFVWIGPLAGFASQFPLRDAELRNFELVSIFPALVLGYILSTRFGKFSSRAWIIPSIILLYKFLTLSEPQSSVLIGHSQNRFEYFFTIVRRMPSFAYDADGGEIMRVGAQLTGVGPFYAGVSYSLGAWAGKHDLLKKLFEHPPIQEEPETEPLLDGAHASVVNESEEALHRPD